MFEQNSNDFGTCTWMIRYIMMVLLQPFMFTEMFISDDLEDFAKLQHIRN